MGDKIFSKELAEKAGLPVLCPIEVKNRKDEDIVRDAELLGLPVLIKASAGGGGRGMKKIEDMNCLLYTSPSPRDA